MKPTISIIIPVYKVERYIERCLMSVISQTYNHTEIECILIDDCTPDHSMVIAQQVIERENDNSIKFVFLKHNENRGLSEARNTGIESANGDYLFFIDSDDYISENCIDCHMEVVRQHPNVEVVLANFYHDKQGSLFRVKEEKIPHFMQGNNHIFPLYLRDVLPMMAWNVLISNNMVSKNNLRFGKGLLQEDILWSFHLYRCSIQVAFVPEKTYIYCDRKDSIMNRTENSSLFAESYYRILSEVSAYCSREFYVDYMLFYVRLLFRGIDYASLPNVDNIYLEQMKVIRNRLFHMALKDGRIILSSVFLFLYKPFSYIKSWNLFRRYYDNWMNVVRIIASFFNFLH